MVNKTNIRILSVILAVMMLITCFASCGKKEFVPPPFDKNAVKGTPNVPDGLGWGEVNGMAYMASICAVVKLEGKTADIYLTNPESNTVWFKLRVFNADGEIIAETGLIRPGEYLKTLTFDKKPKVGDSISMKIMSYQPDTYYSAGAVNLNTTVS